MSFFTHQKHYHSSGKLICRNEISKQDLQTLVYYNYNHSILFQTWSLLKFPLNLSSHLLRYIPRFCVLSWGVDSCTYPTNPSALVSPFPSCGLYFSSLSPKQGWQTYFITQPFRKSPHSILCISLPYHTHTILHQEYMLELHPHPERWTKKWLSYLKAT